MSNDLKRNVMLDGGTASTWRLLRPTPNRDWHRDQCGH